jgi:hypothetical protein
LFDLFFLPLPLFLPFLFLFFFSRGWGNSFQDTQ